VNEKFLVSRQTCRRCKRQLQGTWGRVTPRGWMHKECAIAVAAEHMAASARPIYCLTEDEMEDEILDA
jgi:hypothetical protein